MEIIDITEDKELIKKLSFEAVDSNNPNHRNTKNYIDLHKRDFVKFHILKEKNQIVSFAAMYQHTSWPKNIIKIVDRMYTFQQFRVKNGNGFSSKKPNIKNNDDHGGLCSGQLIPHQFEIAKELNLIPFVSVQLLSRRNAVKRWLDTRIDKKLKFKLLDGMYYVCGGDPKISMLCWQNVLSTDKIELPSINIDMYNRTFKRGKR
jgi:hypothetical protein|tara:strand:+ start:2156 stop:2767 length:612 start_codon:yes stop_codon:yes gene_type:complete